MNTSSQSETSRNETSPRDTTQSYGSSIINTLGHISGTPETMAFRYVFRAIKSIVISQGPTAFITSVSGAALNIVLAFCFKWGVTNTDKVLEVCKKLSWPFIRLVFYRKTQYKLRDITTVQQTVIDKLKDQSDSSYLSPFCESDDIKITLYGIRYIHDSYMANAIAESRQRKLELEDVKREYDITPIISLVKNTSRLTSVELAPIIVYMSDNYKMLETMIKRSLTIQHRTKSYQLVTYLINGIPGLGKTYSMYCVAAMKMFARVIYAKLDQQGFNKTPLDEIISFINEKAAAGGSVFIVLDEFDKYLDNYCDTMWLTYISGKERGMSEDEHKAMSRNSILSSLKDMVSAGPSPSPRMIMLTSNNMSSIVHNLSDKQYIHYEATITRMIGVNFEPCGKDEIQRFIEYTFSDREIKIDEKQIPDDIKITPRLLHAIIIQSTGYVDDYQFILNSLNYYYKNGDIQTSLVSQMRKERSLRTEIKDEFHTGLTSPSEFILYESKEFNESSPIKIDGKNQDTTNPQTESKPFASINKKAMFEEKVRNILRDGRKRIYTCTPCESKLFGKKEGIKLGQASRVSNSNFECPLRASIQIGGYALCVHCYNELVEDIDIDMQLCEIDLVNKKNGFREQCNNEPYANYSNPWPLDLDMRELYPENFGLCQTCILQLYEENNVTMCYNNNVTGCYLRGEINLTDNKTGESIILCKLCAHKLHENCEVCEFKGCSIILSGGGHEYTPKIIENGERLCNQNKDCEKLILCDEHFDIAVRDEMIYDEVRKGKNPKKDDILII